MFDIKKIFIINGRPRSGKDTFIKMVSKYAKTENFSSIDKVKEYALKIGWDGNKDSKGRWFLSELKKILTIYNDIPYKITCEEIEKFLKSEKEIMFIHIREPEEIEKIVKKYNAESIIVNRTVTEEISNDSDRYVDSYCGYTYSLNNDSSFENLDNIAKSFVEYLRKEDKNV